MTAVRHHIVATAFQAALEILTPAEVGRLHGRLGAWLHATTPGTTKTLTPREVEVLHLMAAWSTDTDIAAVLGVSVHTVKTHAGRVFRKLGVSGRRGAVARARELGLIGGDR